MVKPDGYKFEALCLVRDGSESTTTKNVVNKGFHVTEATVLTENRQPVSLFSKIHSSEEKDFSSINTITFSTIERAVSMFGKATFIMDRGYDDNKIFLKFDEMQQDYIIRLITKWKLLYHNKWTKATNYAIAERGKSKHPAPITERKKRFIFLLSKSRSPLPEKTFIWFWYMAGGSIR